MSDGTLAPPRPAAGAVAVWRIRAGAADAVACHLDDEERRRAEALHREAARRLFVAQHGSLRVILAGYLGCAPEEVRYARAVYGKPTLAVGGAALYFNATRRRDLALVAVACDREVGIDLEALQPLPELDVVIRGICTAAEQAALQALDPAARQAAFYRYWTAKEAYLKLRGWGLTVEPNTIAVDTAGAAACSVAGALRDGNPARVVWPAVAAGYTAALAVAGAPPVIHVHDFTPPGMAN